MLVLMMRARESNYSEEGMLPLIYKGAVEYYLNRHTDAMQIVDVIVPQYAEKIAAKPGVEEAESSCG